MGIPSVSAASAGVSLCFRGFLGAVVDIILMHILHWGINWWNGHPRSNGASMGCLCSHFANSHGNPPKQNKLVLLKSLDGKTMLQVLSKVSALLGVCIGVPAHICTDTSHTLPLLLSPGTSTIAPQVFPCLAFPFHCCQPGVFTSFLQETPPETPD